MDFKEFEEQLAEDMKIRLEENGIKGGVEVHEVPKLNDPYDAITVTPEGSNIGVNVNVNHVYSVFEQGADYNSIVEKAVESVQEGLKNGPDIDVNSLMDYEKMKKNLVMEVVSAEANAEMLKDVPHEEMEDLAVVYRFAFYHDDDSRSSVLITNPLIKSMGITHEELHQDALKNAPEIKPAVIRGMTEVLAEMTGMSQEDLIRMGMAVEPSEEQMFVATTPDKTHGAGIIAYQDFMDQAAERVGGDFFILPSSIHEVLLIPDNGFVGLEKLQDMVREVNAKEVAPEEKLTDSVYHYDSKEKIFELGEKYVARQEEKEAGREAVDSERDSVLNTLKVKKDEVEKQPKKHVAEKEAVAKAAVL